MPQKEFDDAMELWPWLRDWRVKPSGPPDKAEDFDGHFQAVWYGFPSQWDDKEIITSATMVELERGARGEYVVTEYTHISEWFMDEPWVAAEHGDFYRLQLVSLKPKFVHTLLRHALTGSPAERQRVPRKKEDIARWVAGIGGAYISYHGGGEDEADTLP